VTPDIEDIKHECGSTECHGNSPAPEWGLASNIMLHCNIDKIMPEIIAIPLAVVLLVGALAFTLIFFRGNDE
jgi:hypothetical protein